MLGYNWSSWTDYTSFIEDHVVPEDKHLVPSLDTLRK